MAELKYSARLRANVMLVKRSITTHNILVQQPVDGDSTPVRFFGFAHHLRAEFFQGLPVGRHEDQPACANLLHHRHNLPRSRDIPGVELHFRQGNVWSIPVL